MFVGENNNQRLIDEGREFLKQANDTCKTCHKKGKCNDCGCGASFKIQNGQLIKSTCLLEKW
jgi:membrane protease subunit (stomatin/prohibitin family)